MIDDQVLEKLDAVISLHVWSEEEAGNVMVCDGYMLAAADSFEAMVMGTGCHGAMPHTGIDPIYIQAQIINAIQGIRSRRLKPTETSVITVGSIQGGNASNVIPDSVTLKGTIRSFNEETRVQLHEELDRAFSIARAMGGDYSLKIIRGYPGLFNNVEVSNVLRQTAHRNRWRKQHH